MKKRVFTIIAILVILIFCVTVNAREKEYGDIFRSWGEYLGSKNSAEQVTKEAAEIYAKGKDIDITNEEMEQTMLFYKLQGIESDKVEETAYNYMKESAALYAKALSLGYSVTDNEVDAYVDELRKMTESEELDAYSRQQVEAIIEGFGDKEAYWEYEKVVYHKLLVSQKYVGELQKEFYSAKSNGNEMWDDYYSKYKTKLVEEQQFEKVK